MSGLGCIHEPELQAFLLGQLPRRIAQIVSGHLEGCQKCEAVAQRLDGRTDAILRALRRAATDSSATVDSVAVSERRGFTAGIATTCGALPQRIGSYEVLEEIGRGGMGVVYKARQEYPDRVVALKMILTGTHSDATRRARLLSEADAIARLRHPYIVHIYEVGQCEGLPFLSLEYVDGGNLADKLRGTPMPPSKAAMLAERVSRAIDHAHQQGIVHRDLKPANILLTAEGTPKVTDFGLAKQDRPELTATGTILGTPHYMAPEQAAGDNRAVGPAVDIYAIGAILYEMLTGRPPFRGATTLETLEQVRTQEPVSPSHLQVRTPRDLGTICLKCLRKEPGQRYASAGALADDLRRFLDYQPILARPVGVVERVWRWSRRNPGWAAMLGIVATLLLVIAAGASVGVVQLRQALAESDRHLDRARQAERDTEVELIDTLVARARANCLSRRPGQRFESLAILADAARRARRLRLPSERFFELRNAAIFALAVPDLHLGHSWKGVPEDSGAVDFDSELAVYARTDSLGNCEVRRVAGNELLHRLPGGRDGGSPNGGLRDSGTGPKSKNEGFFTPFLSPNACFLAVLRHGADHHLSIFRLDAEPKLLDEAKDVWGVDYHPDGRQLALAHGDGAVSLYDLDSGKWRRLPAEISVEHQAVALHPTEPLVAVASPLARTVLIRDLASGAVIKSLLFPASIWDVAWHPHGHTLAVSDDVGLSIHLYERASFREVRTLRSAGRGTRLAFNRAGDRLAGASWDRELQLFDMPSGKLLFQVSAHVPMYRPRFSSDGRRLACEASNGRLGVWEVGEAREYRNLSNSRERDRTIYSWADIGADNRLLAVAISGGLHFWDLETGREIGRLPVETAEFPHFVPGQPEVLMTGGRPGLIQWPIEPRRGAPGTLRIGPPKTLAPIDGFCCSHTRDGRMLVANVLVNRSPPDAGGWVFRAGQPNPLCLEKGKDVLSITVSPDGNWVVTCLNHPSSLQVWDARGDRLDQKEIRPVKDLPARNGYFPRFSPDGRWLVFSGEPGGVYDVKTWDLSLQFNGRGQFAPDSHLLAVATATGVIQLLDVGTGRKLARLEDPDQAASLYYVFSPDGTRLVNLTKGREAGIHVWDLRAIRRQLKALDLDWDAPDYRPEPPSTPTPLRLDMSFPRR